MAPARRRRFGAEHLPQRLTAAVPRPGKGHRTRRLGLATRGGQEARQLIHLHQGTTAEQILQLTLVGDHLSLGQQQQAALVAHAELQRLAELDAVLDGGEGADAHGWGLADSAPNQEIERSS
jgi:hypothetical protein